MAVLFIIHTESDNSSAEVVGGGWCGQNAYYYIYSDGTLDICGTGAMYDYSGFTHPPWYDSRDDITKIVISDGITQLGVSAFIGLKHVTELIIPIPLNSVVSDVSPAFAGCFNIEKISFTLGKDGCGYNYAAYCGSDSWYQNTPWYQSRDSLKEISFAYGTEYIGSDSFRELNITSLVIPDTVGSLGCHCFFNCTELTDLTIPISLNSVGNETYPAFQGCVAVENVTFTRGNGVPYDYSRFWTSGIYDLAPWNLNGNIEKTIIISDDVPDLGVCMFYHCNIKDLTLPINSLNPRDSGRCAFLNPYKSLVSVTLTKGTGVGVDYKVFKSVFPWDNIPWNGAPNLKTFVIEEGVRYIGNYTFYGCHTEKLVLPNSLCEFDTCPFYAITVRDLTIPISLNAVWLDDYEAFYKVSGIEKITFTPGSGYGFDYAASKGSNAWYQLTPWYMCRDTLKEVVFDSGITYIGANIFAGYSFVGSDGEYLEHTSENLSGHLFCGTGGIMYLSDCTAEDQNPIEKTVLSISADVGLGSPHKSILMIGLGTKHL